MFKPNKVKGSNINSYLNLFSVKVNSVGESTRLRDFSCFHFQVIMTLPGFKCQSLLNMTLFDFFYFFFVRLFSLIQCTEFFVRSVPSER